MVNQLELQRDQVRSFIRKHEQVVTEAKERRIKQQCLLNDPELQHQHAEQEKRKEAIAATQEAQKRTKQLHLQSEQLTKRHAEQMAETNKLLASIHGGKPITKVDKVTTESEATKLSDDELYKQTILTMVKARISQQKRK